MDTHSTSLEFVRQAGVPEEHIQLCVALREEYVRQDFSEMGMSLTMLFTRVSQAEENHQGATATLNFWEKHAQLLSQRNPQMALETLSWCTLSLVHATDLKLGPLGSTIMKCATSGDPKTHINRKAEVLLGLVQLLANSEQTPLCTDLFNQAVPAWTAACDRLDDDKKSAMNIGLMNWAKEANPTTQSRLVTSGIIDQLALSQPLLRLVKPTP